jgi:hypothetical protein
LLYGLKDSRGPDTGRLTEAREPLHDRSRPVLAEARLQHFPEPIERGLDFGP